MKFIEARGHQKQTLVEVMTMMKDLEKADAMHSEEHKCKEKNKQRDGKKGLTKGNQKMVKTNAKSRRINAIETKAKVATTKANVHFLAIITIGLIVPTTLSQATIMAPAI